MLAEFPVCEDTNRDDSNNRVVGLEADKTTYAKILFDNTMGEQAKTYWSVRLPFHPLFQQCYFNSLKDMLKINLTHTR